MLIGGVVARLHANGLEGDSENPLALPSQTLIDGAARLGVGSGLEDAAHRKNIFRRSLGDQQPFLFELHDNGQAAALEVKWRLIDLPSGFGRGICTAENRRIQGAADTGLELAVPICKLERTVRGLAVRRE